MAKNVLVRNASTPDRRVPSDLRSIKRFALAFALLVIAACGREGRLVLPQPTAKPTSIDISPVLVSAAQRVGVDLPALVRGTYDRVEGVLHGTPPKITLEPKALVVPEIGLNGRTDPGNGSVRLFVALVTRPGFRATLERWVPSSLAHELDHSKRLLDGPGFEPSLGSRMIFEGLASAFQRDLYPNDVPPWTEALTPVQELELWAKVKPLLHEYASNDVAGPWFFGTGDIPRWAGYTIGYDIVRSYLKRHPGSTAAAATTLPWKTILQGSGYEGRRP